MPDTYWSREVIEEADAPSWSKLQPGYDGCNSYLTSLTSRHDSMPTATQMQYEPIQDMMVRDSRRISGRTHGIPPFRMTPYFVNRNTVKHHLVKRRNCLTTGFRNYWQDQHTAKNPTVCTRMLDVTYYSDPMWTKYYDVSSSDNSTEYALHTLDANLISDGISSVEDDVATKALTSYDVLTDIVQAKEIPELLRSISSDLLMVLKGLNGRFNINDLRTASRLPVKYLLKSPKKVFKKIGDEWMQYRYAIMTLIYSIRDIEKTLNRGWDVTTRSHKIIQPQETGVTLPPSTSQYKWSEIVGNVKISGTVYQYFKYDGVSRYAGLGFNPLVTAWEMIPYSFVIDWFVNIGSYITRMTTNSMADKHWACISQRSDYVRRTWIHYPTVDKSVAITNRLCSNWLGSSPPATPSQTYRCPEESLLLTEEITNEYWRWLIYLDDARLEFSPSLNWRRLVDSAVMSLNQLGAFNKHLKGA